MPKVQINLTNIASKIYIVKTHKPYGQIESILKNIEYLNLSQYCYVTVSVVSSYFLNFNGYS